VKTEVFSLATSTFRMVGKNLQYLWSTREWLDVWEIRVIENHGDLAIDFNSKSRLGKVCSRTEPVKEGHSRLTTDLDIVMFDLENGKRLFLELSEEVNAILRSLRLTGVKYSKGRDVERSTPDRPEA